MQPCVVEHYYCSVSMNVKSAWESYALLCVLVHLKHVPSGFPNCISMITALTLGVEYIRIIVLGGGREGGKEREGVRL